MHKILLFLLVIVWFLAAPIDSRAQVTRDPVQTNGPVSNIATLPVNINPEDIVKPDPSKGESAQSGIFVHPDSTKHVAPKNGSNSQVQKTSTQTTVVDKYGHVVTRYTPEEKAGWTEAQHAERQAQVSDQVSGNGLIYPDLQVTATPESPQIQVFQGSERLPKPAEKKTVPNAEKTEAPNNNQTSTIGKVSFLKQYASDLKLQIEKNKNNANYPLAEKQQELLELENLLKGE